MLPDPVLADLRAAWRWPGAAARVRRYLATPGLDPALRSDAAELLAMADEARRRLLLAPLRWLACMAGACVLAPAMLLAGAPHLLERHPEREARRLEETLRPRHVYLPPPSPEEEEEPVLLPDEVTRPVHPGARDVSSVTAAAEPGPAVPATPGAIGTASPLARPGWLVAMQDGGGGAEDDGEGGGGVTGIPEGMVYLPAGRFSMGSLAGTGEPHEHPRHAVEISAFAIDRDEVSVAAFTRWCNAHRDRCGWTPDDSASLMADHPATGVTWAEAQSYCLALGKSLPTEAQWEYAALYDPGAAAPGPYPWGAAPPSCRLANFMDCHLLRTVPLGSTGGATSLGVRDMAGNAREWVLDRFGRYDGSPQRDPRGPASGELRVLRGGSFGGAADDIRVTDRDVGDPDERSFYNGFRCAVPVEEAPADEPGAPDPDAPSDEGAARRP